MAKRTNRVAWGLAAILAVVVLGGGGLVFVRLRPYWVARYRGAHAHLRGASLPYAALGRADLHGADLERADLHGADLRKANLGPLSDRPTRVEVDAYFQSTPGGADLRGANLRGSDLRSTLLYLTKLDDADMSQANLSRAELCQVKMGSVDLKRANMASALPLESDLSQTNLEGVTLTGALYDRHTRWPQGFDPKLRGARLLEPSMNLRGANLDGFILLGQDLRRANLQGASLQSTMLVSANLANTNLVNANLASADLALADLTGANLTGAILKGSNLWRGKYDLHTRWPASFDPLKHGAVLVK